MPIFEHHSEAVKEKELIDSIISYWEAGYSWEHIADRHYLTIEELLAYPEVQDLFYK